MLGGLFSKTKSKSTLMFCVGLFAWQLLSGLGLGVISGSAWPSERMLRNRLWSVEWLLWSLGRQSRRLRQGAVSGPLTLLWRLEAGAAALETSCCWVSSLSAWAEESVARVVRDLGSVCGVVLFSVFISLPYNLAVWVLVMLLNIPLYRFWLPFL
jgi:hypothetical protein